MNWYLCRKGLLSGPYTTQAILKDLSTGRVLWTDPIWGTRVSVKKWARVCDMPAFREAMPPLPKDKLILEIPDVMKVSSRPSLLDALEPLQLVFSELVKKFAGLPSDVPLSANKDAPKDANEKNRPEPTAGPRGPKPQSQAHPQPVQMPSPAHQGKGQGVEWYLICDAKEFGPLTLREAVLILKSGRLKGKILARKDGMEQAVSVEEVAELDVNAHSLRKIVQVKHHKGEDKRVSQRAPLLAEVHFSSGEGVGDLSVYSGICRDISVRGMLILATRCPTTLGVKVKLNVAPLKNQGIGPFTTMAEVVRILPDKNGFSVRFDKMPETALAALTSYVAGKA
jgi:hypothetical protein